MTQIDLIAPVTPGLRSALSGMSLVSATKWLASTIQILGYAATGLGWTPWNLYLFSAGIIGWFIVGLMWKDRAIVLLHIAAFASMMIGMSAS